MLFHYFDNINCHFFFILSYRFWQPSVLSETELPKSQVSRINFYFIIYVSRIFISGIYHPNDCFDVESL